MKRLIWSGRSWSLTSGYFYWRKTGDAARTFA
jgi:hypothetical protein